MNTSISISKFREHDLIDWSIYAYHLLYSELILFAWTFTLTPLPPIDLKHSNFKHSEKQFTTLFIRSEQFFFKIENKIVQSYKHIINQHLNMSV